MCLDGEAEDAALAGYGDEGLDAQASDDRSVCHRVMTETGQKKRIY